MAEAKITAVQKVIVEDIVSERSRQDAQWGGRSHDEEHARGFWVVLVTKWVGKVARTVLDDHYDSILRHQLLKLVAILFAWIEVLDRRIAVQSLDDRR